MSFCWSDVSWVIPKDTSRDQSTIQIAATPYFKIVAQRKEDEPSSESTWSWACLMTDWDVEEAPHLSTVMSALPSKPWDYPPFLVVIGEIPVDHRISTELYFKPGDMGVRSFPASHLTGCMIVGRNDYMESFRMRFSHIITAGVYVYHQV